MSDEPVSPAVETTCLRCGAVITVPVDVVTVSDTPLVVRLVPALSHVCSAGPPSLPGP